MSHAPDPRESDTVGRSESFPDGGADVGEHPLRAFRDAGVTVTIGSDDPPMFNTTLNREYEIAADLLGLDQDGVADLARASVRASFAPTDVRTRILGEIDAYVDAAGTA